MPDLLVPTKFGFHCPPGDFYIDPLRPVDRALITHAHSDHVRPGSRFYLTAQPGVGLLRLRLARSAVVQGINFGQHLDIQGVRVSFYPSGHILGAAQIRLEHAGEVWVVSGDYKLAKDPTCHPFEPVRCHTFVTESTFGLPIYRWRPAALIFQEIVDWWLRQRDRGRTCVLLVYSCGKAQRLLASLPGDIGPILMHHTIAAYTEVYAERRIALAPALVLPKHTPQDLPRGCLILIPPGTSEVRQWLARPEQYSVAMVSGWAQVRAIQRRSGACQGFTLSDHADWPGLLEAIDATQAEKVWVTHGFTGDLARWMTEHGRCAMAVDPGAQEVMLRLTSS